MKNRSKALADSNSEKSPKGQASIQTLSSYPISTTYARRTVKGAIRLNVQQLIMDRDFETILGVIIGTPCAIISFFMILYSIIRKYFPYDHGSPDDQGRSQRTIIQPHIGIFFKYSVITVEFAGYSYLSFARNFGKSRSRLRSLWLHFSSILKNNGLRPIMYLQQNSNEKSRGVIQRQSARIREHTNDVDVLFYRLHPLDGSSVFFHCE